jgi:hypothetical protein
VGKELRIDVGTLRPAKRRADGTLLVEGVLTRAGVFVYQDASGGERREYRPPAEVFKADSMGSFELVPLTNDHPGELVTAENARQYAIGAVGAPRRDGDKMIAAISVFDAETIAKIDDGKQELSCGYLVEVVNKPGVTPEGERYDAVQREIVGNHVALVDVARAGHVARIRMDGVSGAAYMKREEATMVKYKIDGVDFDVPEQVAQAFAKQDAAKSESLAAEKARADAAEGTSAAEKARADGLEKELETERKARQDAEDPAKITAKVRLRADLENAARSVLGAETDVSGLSDLDIQIAVVEKVDGDKIAANEHERYVRGRFDSACKRAARSDADLARLRPLARDDARRNEAELDETIAARKMAEDSANAWKSSSKESK